MQVVHKGLRWICKDDYQEDGFVEITDNTFPPTNALCVQSWRGGHFPCQEVQSTKPRVQRTRFRVPCTHSLPCLSTVWLFFSYGGQPEYLSLFTRAASGATPERFGVAACPSRSRRELARRPNAARAMPAINHQLAMSPSPCISLREKRVAVELPGQAVVSRS